MPIEWPPEFEHVLKQLGDPVTEEGKAYRDQLPNDFYDPRESKHARRLLYGDEYEEYDEKYGQKRTLAPLPREPLRLSTTQEQYNAPHSYAPSSHSDQRVIK